MEKQSQILYHFHKARTKISFLQETHFRIGSIPAIHNYFYHTWYHSTNPQAKSKGVSIAFHKSFDPEILECLIDPSGHFIFLKLKYKTLIFTVANIYKLSQEQGLSWLQSLIG